MYIHSELVISEGPELEWFQTHFNMSPLETTPVAFVGDLKIMASEHGRVLLVVIPTKVSFIGDQDKYEVLGEFYIRRQGNTFDSAFTKASNASMTVSLQKKRAVISVDEPYIARESETRYPHHVGPSPVREPFVPTWLRNFRFRPRPKPLPISSSQSR